MRAEVGRAIGGGEVKWERAGAERTNGGESGGREDEGTRVIGWRA